MTVTVAKEHLQEAATLIDQARETGDRIQIVGLIDVAKDELAKALKQAKEREGFKEKKQREVKGQMALPDGKPKRSREPKGATGVNGAGVVTTPADTEDFSIGEDPFGPVTDRASTSASESGSGTAIPAGYQSPGLVLECNLCHAVFMPESGKHEFGTCGTPMEDPNDGVCVGELRFREQLAPA